MATGRARVMQQTDPRKVRVIHQSKVRWFPVWDHNPRLAKPNERGDFQTLYARDAANNRPYHTAKTPERWTYNLDFRPDVGEIYLTDAEKAFGKRYANRIILEPHIKAGASPNKRWPWVSWNKLAWRLQERGHKVTQIGPIGTQLLAGGVEHVITNDFRSAAAVIGSARACVLSEGGLHHAAAALGVPAVVIFGGFTPVELTGYPGHVNIGASLGDACGMRFACEHCKAIMAGITPDRVFNELEKILDGNRVDRSFAENAA